MFSSEPWVIALVSAITSGCITIIGATFWFGRNTVTKDDLIAATATTTTEIHELRGEIDNHGREVGETILAIRTKITEVELYVRDTFVRRDSWHQAMNQLQATIGASDVADQQWKLRIEGKLDQMSDRIGQKMVVHGPI